MKKRIIIPDFSEFSLDELKKQERSQKIGVWIASGLLLVLLIITVIYWIRQDFSLSSSGLFNPVIYCGFGLFSLGSLALGMAGALKKVRAEIKSRQ